MSRCTSSMLKDGLTCPTMAWRERRRYSLVIAGQSALTPRRAPASANARLTPECQSRMVPPVSNVSALIPEIMRFLPSDNMGGQMPRALLFGLVACAYVALAVIKTLPLSRTFTTHLPSDLGDPLLTTWIMAWGSHALAHHPLSLFDANLLYPLDRTLAFSDHLLGVLPIFAPVYAATGNQIAAANTVFLLSFALSAFAAFCLTYMLTSAPWPSFLAGLLFG